MSFRLIIAMAIAAAFVSARTLADNGDRRQLDYRFSHEKIEATLNRMPLSEANLIHSGFLLQVIDSVYDDASNPKGKLDFLKSLCFYRKNDYMAASQSIKRAIALSASDPAYLWHRARVKLKNNQLDAADADCEAALSLDPGFSSAILAKAAVALKRHDAEEARRILESYQRFPASARTP